MISAIVLAKNEEKMITACLEPIKWVDEIIVADNGSTDKTVEIAKKFTDEVLNLRENDFSSWRNKAMESASGDWVLYVDPDERVLRFLKQEIEALIALDGNSAYAISRKNIIFGQSVAYGPYKKDWVIRLFKKANFEGWTGKIHESPKFKGGLGYCKNPLLHLTHRDIDQIVLKSLEWSKVDAQLRFDSNHPKMSGLRFIRILVTEIFNQGIRRKGFFNGTVGVMDAVLQVFSLFITYVRLWQMQEKKILENVYRDIDKELIDSNFEE